MKSQLAEVQTGFEPPFFHIQADYQWQRPFSEGRDDRFSEKTKKNLSQNYGRWIVGFHEPMTSAFFALKKGAADWRYCMSKELTPQKERFLREVEQKLLHRELDARLLEDGLIHVRWNEKPLCSCLLYTSFPLHTVTFHKHFIKEISSKTVIQYYIFLAY